MDMLDKEVNHVLGEMEQNETTFHHSIQNDARFELTNYFWNFIFFLIFQVFNINLMNQKIIKSEETRLTLMQTQL